MKFTNVMCCLFGLLAVMSLAMAQTPDIEATKQACLKEANAPLADVQKFVTNGLAAADATEPVKCFIKCLMEKRGDFKSGVFDADAFVKTAQTMPQFSGRQAEVAKAAAACKGEKGANACDTAYKIATCFKTNKLDFGLTKP